MNLLNFYDAILRSAGFIVNDEGAVSIALTSHREPMTIGGKRLVIPTQAQLKAADFSQRIVFHPLAEDVLSGESKVFQRYRTTLNRRLNLVFVGIMTELMQIAISPAMHGSLSPAQSEFLINLGEADEKTFQNLVKVVGHMPITDAEKNFVSIYLKRNGKLGTTNYPRLAVVKFPLYSELCNTKDNTIFGVKLRVKDVALIKSLLEWMLPGINEPELNYYAGSNSQIAPYTDALLQAASKLITRSNEIVNLQWVESDKYDDLVINHEWAEDIEDLGTKLKEIRLIPNQDQVAVTNEVAVQAPAAPVPAAPVAGRFDTVVTQAVAVQPPVQQPQQFAPQPQMQQPVQQAGAGKVTSLNDLMTLQHQQQVQANPYMAMAYNNGMMPQQQMQQPNPMVVTGYNNYGQPVNAYGQVVQMPQQQMYNGWTVPMQAPAPMPMGPGVIGVGEYGYPIKR